MVCPVFISIIWYGLIRVTTLYYGGVALIPLVKFYSQLDLMKLNSVRSYFAIVTLIKIKIYKKKKLYLKITSPPSFYLPTNKT